MLVSAGCAGVTYSAVSRIRLTRHPIVAAELARLRRGARVVGRLGEGPGTRVQRHLAHLQSSHWPAGSVLHDHEGVRPEAWPEIPAQGRLRPPQGHTRKVALTDQSHGHQR